MRDAQSFDLFMPPLVLFAQMVVDRAVHIHRELQFLAVKIHDASAQRPLPVEVLAAKLFSPEMIPKQHLGERHLAAQAVGECFQVRPVWNNRLLHGWVDDSRGKHFGR